MTRRGGRPYRRATADQHPGFYARAACRSTLNPEIFYPEQGNRNTVYVTKICNSCPVKAQCLEYALSFGPHDQWGFWGGMSADARIQLLRKQGATS